MKKINSYPVEFYKTRWRREWRWRIKATNGKIVGSSSEGFKNKIDCEHNAKIVRKSLQLHKWAG